MLRDDGVLVRRSVRRTRTASATTDADGSLVVHLPATVPRGREEDRWVESLRATLERRGASRRPSDEGLQVLADQVARRFLPDGVRAASVRWATQQRRWGSCSPAGREVRVSTRLRGAPSYVLEDVLLHELAHLVHPDHSPEFHALADRHPRHERAVGYLEALGDALRQPGGADGRTGRPGSCHPAG